MISYKHCILLALLCGTRLVCGRPAKTPSAAGPLDDLASFPSADRKCFSFVSPSAHALEEQKIFCQNVQRTSSPTYSALSYDADGKTAGTQGSSASTTSIAPAILTKHLDPIPPSALSPTTLDQSDTARSFKQATRSSPIIPSEQRDRNERHEPRAPRHFTIFNNSNTSMSSSVAAPAAAAAASSINLGGFLSSAIHEIESALATAVSTTAESTPTTTNALSVLESALSTGILSAVESDLSAIFGGATNTPLTSSTSLSPHSPTRSHTRTREHSEPTPIHTGRPTDPPMNKPPFAPTTSHTTLSTSSSTSTSRSTSTPTTTLPQHTAGANATEQEHVVGSHPLPNAAVAGIASGLTAGAVIVGLAGLYLWRRKQQGKPFFGKKGPQVYPEVAWLYDPVRERPQSPEMGQTRSRGDSNANLLPIIPDPRPGSVEIAGSELSLPSHRPSSPLLMPEIGVYGENQPYDPHSRPNSEDNLRLPRLPDDHDGA